MEIWAPGRVNLIGEHTDYSDGWCLPVAIDLGCRITARPGGDPGAVVARSRQLSGVVRVETGPCTLPPDSPRWGRFVRGAVEVLANRGYPPSGTELVIDSTVPPGAGLSSSSALSVALVLALLPDGAPEHRDPVALARLALAAEVEATGVPGGLLDQMASLHGRAGHALLLDCRHLTVEPVPLPPALGLLVVHSGITRELAESAYAARRAACEAAAARLGVPALRDATLDQVRSDPIARHVVTENQRVHDTVAALEAGDLATVGALLAEGHASLRDDFQVSRPEVDALVDLLERHGAWGARLTGAGFGGCVVAVAPRDRLEGIADGAVAEYHARTGRSGRAFVVRAVDGARRHPADPVRT